MTQGTLTGAGGGFGKLSADPIRDLSIREVLKTGDKIDLSPRELKQLADELTLPKDDLDTWIEALNRKKGCVFYGPPGTGKTFAARKIAEKVTDNTSNESDIVQFHQSYEYEDFMQGIRPVLDGNNRSGSLNYEMQKGKFYEFCKKAEKLSGPCILIIDEINRADVSSVFGELMYLLEYRDEEIHLSQDSEDGEKFSIPRNVYLIGTMNTADRSIALVDFALRRRFAFLPLYPNYDVLREKFDANDVDTDDLIEVLEKINDEIGDKQYSLGYSYFLDADVRSELANIWKMEIEPYLEEYFVDDPDTVDDYRWENISDEIGK
jgi:5-methylcytosine-specific restriction protein B